MTRKIFISSTSDLREYRESAAKAILRAALYPVMMEYFASSGAAPPLAQCLKKVKESNAVVVLVAHQYGWVPPEQIGNEHKSITWLECEQAVNQGKEVLAFFLSDDFPWPENLKEEFGLVAKVREDKAVSENTIERIQNNYRALKRFKEWLNSTGIRSTFTTPGDLEAQVLHALIEWRRPHGTTRLRHADAEADIFTFRAAYRRQLTNLMCAYYRDVVRDGSIVVSPDDTPVLAQPQLLFDQPLPLKDFEQRMSLDRSETPPPGDAGPSTMVSLMRRQEPNGNLFNGLLFRFLGIDGTGHLRFRPGYYFDFLNTSEVLGYELARVVLTNSALKEIVIAGDGVADHKTIALLGTPKLLPLRARIKPTDFESRCTAFGSCALVVLKRTNKVPQMILNVRSSNLAETPGLTHVIPAGTFQPTMQDDRFQDAEFSLTENLVREFAEELFDDDGISGRKARRIVFGDLDDLYGPQGKAFRAGIIHPNKYKLFYLGTVIDPVNLKPEALTVFMLHEGYLSAVAGKELAPSWETEAGKILLHDFTEDRITRLIHGSNLVPTGKAHLMLVKKHFRSLLGQLDAV